MDFKVYYDNQRKLIENFLETRMAKKGISKVDDAMAYSLLAGGKRIRPVLLMATAEALGKLVKGMLCHVNLIPVNNVEENEFRKPSKDKINELKGKE